MRSGRVLLLDLPEVEGDTWVDLAEAVPEIAPMTMREDSHIIEKVKILREELKKVQLELDKDPHNANLKEDDMNFLGTCDEVFPIEDLDRLFDKKLSGESALFMIRDITDDEIKDALRDIDDNKALGPDGFTSKFFKASWQTTGKDLCAVVKEFFSSGKIAFIDGRHNSDIIMVAQELMCRYSRNKKIGRCTFKVDIQKAYDTVSWDFLKESHGFFKARRGLRKGDHVSPYLFTIVIEMFTRILRRQVNKEKKFKYHSGCKKLNILSLCFANDLMLFCHGDLIFASVLRRALDEFYLASGLRPNMAKSTVFYGNVKDEVKRDIEIVMPFSEGILPVKYLGIPLDSSRISKNDCKVLIENVKKRIDHWRNKYLSFAGRLQLIDSILSSLNVFWASIFILPQGMCEDIDKILKNFLWRNDEKKGCKYSVAWKEKFYLGEMGKKSMVKRWHGKDPLCKLVSQDLLMQHSLDLKIKIPKIIENLKDKAVWINKNGKEKTFRVHKVWKSMKINSVKERNLRLFGDTGRTKDELFKIIFEIVRSRLMGLQLKVTPEVIKAAKFMMRSYRSNLGRADPESYERYGSVGRQFMTSSGIQVCVGDSKYVCGLLSRCLMNDSMGVQLARIRIKDLVQFRRTSLTGFPTQSIRSSYAIALDSPFLLVLITGTSQSRQHVVSFFSDSLERVPVSPPNHTQQEDHAFLIELCHYTNSVVSAELA
ncbi:RNA-directed DNA polymerase, eukaryota, reverse transcriptase zinc-binding domain protein [Tanacetum coccineum]|uniref:RNA-directed DNA polymerase, eukaryota, reverse transcriptase zinc-binding domain protein n=1 Tax=Tanacetum coccineum TaxID=301880 RepID=A0ABQ5BCZ7_9ASTR